MGSYLTNIGVGGVCLDFRSLFIYPSPPPNGCGMCGRICKASHLSMAHSNALLTKPHQRLSDPTTSKGIYFKTSLTFQFFYNKSQYTILIRCIFKMILYKQVNCACKTGKTSYLSNVNYAAFLSKV